MQKEKHVILQLVVNTNIHRKTPVLESLFNEVAGMNFIKKRLQQRCFPKNI